MAGKAVIAPPPAHPRNGDVFRTLGLPENLIAGLDTMAMTTNKSLLGFRDIPPGPHFLWVQLPGGVSRCGYWFSTGAQGTVRTKQWDSYNEVLAEPTSQLETQSQKDNAESVYATLQPYTLCAQKDQASMFLDNTHPEWARSPANLWNSLTSAISNQDLARIAGGQNIGEYLVDSIDCAKDTRLGEILSATAAADSVSSYNKLTFLFAQDFRDLQVLDLGPASARVADTSARIQALLAHPTDPATEQAVLAELQFTFLTGTHLSNPACLEQWWNLVLKIVLRAHALPVSHPRLAGDLLRTLHAQLLYTEHYIGSSETNDDGDSGGSGRNRPSDDTPIFQYKPVYREKLRRALVEYRRRLDRLLAGDEGHATAEQEAVGKVYEALETWLRRCGWDLRGGGRTERTGVATGEVDSEEEEDELPVVVELDEEGRKVGLVSFRD